MGYACLAKTVQRVVQSMGYHKRVPRKKFNHIWFLYGIGAVRSMGGRYWWRMVHQAIRGMLKFTES